jgi:hypothetical protein
LRIDAFELVAPVLRYGPGDKDKLIRDNYGLDAITQLYSFFDECGFTILVNDSCSSHVHLSPELVPVAVKPRPADPKEWFRLESAWTLQRLKNMASAALYFEVPMRSLMAPSRRGNKYAREFHTRIWLGAHYEDYFSHPSETDLAVIQELQKIDNVEALQGRVNPENRWWTWNYRNLKSDVTAPKQSLEFRWPAGSTHCECYPSLFRSTCMR